MSMKSIDKVFNEDSSLDTKAIISALWENRTDTSTIEILVDILIKYITDRKVFDAIEFYLPQLTHMLIHFGNSPTKHPLEHLIVVLCQSSVHTALHISFILFAAMEDYQPEDTLGRSNPSVNIELFSHVASIMRNVERAVVQGDIVSYILDRDRIASMSAEELAEKEDMFRSQTAEDIVKFSREYTANSNTSTSIIHGPLMFKRVQRQSFHRKIWKSRWFRIEGKVLMCYHDSNFHTLRRTLPLQDCRVDIVSNPHHDNCFEVYSPITGTLFKLRAEQKDEMLRWIEAINAVINDVPTSIVLQSPVSTEKGSKDVISPSSSTASDSADISSAADRDSIRASPFVVDGAVTIGANSALALLKTTSLRHNIMNRLEKKRYRFFTEQRMFIGKLTDICEELRFLERSERGEQLRLRIAELEIPQCCYLALGNSTDTWSRVIKALPQEVHAFSTKARCPALLLFEMKDNIDGLDVATFLGSEALGDDYPDATTAESVEVVVGHTDPDHPTRSFFRTFDAQMSRTRRASVSAVIARESHMITDSADPADNALMESHRLSQDAMVVEHVTSAEDVLAKVVCHPNGSTGKDTGDGEDEGEDQDVDDGGMETFAAKTMRIKAASDIGDTPGWRLDGLIAKSNDDLRQEVFVMQLIMFLERIFKDNDVPVWLLSYRIISTSKNTGLIQLIPDAISLDGLKKGVHWPGSLRLHFEQKYGNPESTTFRTALDAYIRSLAGYSVVTYILAIKDRHNGNVMIDTQGHLIHIDFGFVFGLAPGKQFSMETAPWKLTEEMVDVMGGTESVHFERFLSLTTEAFKVARRYTQDIAKLMEIMSHQSCYPAFRYNPHAIADMKNRMMLAVADNDLRETVQNLTAR